MRQRKREERRKERERKRREEKWGKSARMEGKGEETGKDEDSEEMKKQVAEDNGVFKIFGCGNNLYELPLSP